MRLREGMMIVTRRMSIRLREKVVSSRSRFRFQSEMELFKLLRLCFFSEFEFEFERLTLWTLPYTMSIASFHR